MNFEQEYYSKMCEGYGAYFLGYENPYEPGSDEFEAWLDGSNAANNDEFYGEHGND